MQKKIFMNLLIVSLCGIVLTTVVLFAIQTIMAHNTADRTILSRLENVEERIRQNEMQIEKLTDAAKEDYLSRARALAVMIELEPDIIEDQGKLDEVVAALDVDEVHIIDGDGILRWGTQPEYYGMDFASTDQTRPFLAILEDPAIEIAQDPMPNGAAGLMRQYAGVSLRHTKGIAEVGMVPERLEAALENNRICNVLEGVTVGDTGYVFAVSTETGAISSHHNAQLIGEFLRESLQSAGFITVDNQRMRYGTRDIGDHVLVAVIPVEEIYKQRTIYTIIFMAFIVTMFGVLYGAVSTHIKKSVTNGISDIVNTLDKISAGNLDVTINVRSSEEFEKLSSGINQMLERIKAKMAEVAEMTDDLRRLGAIVAIADAGIIVKDRDGFVQEWNIGAESILGYTAEEIVGKSTKYYAPPDAHAGIDEIDGRLKEGEHIVHIEVVRKHKDGRLIDCSASYTPVLDDHSNYIGSVAIFHDISDKKQIEHALKAAVLAAEQANSAKTSFLANMSHEIRTPMNGIIGFSELALDDIGSTEKTRDYLNKIKISAEGLLQIINDILDISKIEAGKMELEKIPFYLHEVFKICETICAPKADEKGVGLCFYEEAPITEKLFGDPIKLRQILLNLLTNAIKFTHKGTVRLTYTVEKSSDDDMTIRFTVEDSGIGMSQEQIQKAFEPFTQADSSTTRQYGGTGLGLAITKSMIELMGGELQAESEVGKGSRFSFSISFEIAETVGGTSDYKEKQDGERPIFTGEILVCEDNAINQQVIQGHLSRVGLNATVVENGKLGIEAVRNKKGKPFDLILMDIHMPVMDGVEASKKLMDMGNTVPIVALTANAMLKDKEIYLENGMTDHLTKPFTAQDLWACLRKYLAAAEKPDAAGAGLTEEEFEQSGGKMPEKESGPEKTSALDRQSGIKNSCDDEELYNGLLLRFSKDNKTTVQSIRNAVQAGDAILAHRTAHTLKSVAGIIGARELQKAALTVENALSAGGAAPEDDMETLETALNAVLAEIEPLARTI